jgi:hypothetical protein
MGTSVYYLASGESNAIAKGDPVKIAGSADAAGIAATVTRASAGDAIIGAVVGFLPDKAYEDQTHRSASIARYVIVADHPSQLFSIQEDSVGGSLAATSVGQNADMIIAAVDTATGLSNVELDSSTAATTATLVLKVISRDPAVNNAIGTNCRWIVKINNHQYGSSTGTAGV